MGQEGAFGLRYSRNHISAAYDLARVQRVPRVTSLIREQVPIDETTTPGSVLLGLFGQKNGFRLEGCSRRTCSWRENGHQGTSRQHDHARDYEAFLPSASH